MNYSSSSPRCSVRFLQTLTLTTCSQCEQIAAVRAILFPGRFLAAPLRPRLYIQILQSVVPARLSFRLVLFLIKIAFFFFCALLLLQLSCFRARCRKIARSSGDGNGRNKKAQIERISGNGDQSETEEEEKRICLFQFECGPMGNKRQKSKLS